MFFCRSVAPSSTLMDTLSTVMMPSSLMVTVHSDNFSRMMPYSFSVMAGMGLDSSSLIEDVNLKERKTCVRDEGWWGDVRTHLMMCLLRPVTSLKCSSM